MGLIETVESLDTQYATAVADAEKIRQDGFSDAIIDMGIDRSETLDTTDHETAFIHFLGKDGFMPEPFGLFRGLANRVSQNLQEDGRAPMLFRGIKTRETEIEPEFVRPWYTSLAIAKGSELILRSSVELIPNVETYHGGRQTDITARRLGIVAETATLRADLANNEEVKESVDQSIISGDFLPFYLQVEDSKNGYILRSGRSYRSEQHSALPYELSGTGIGWGEILDKLEDYMEFSHDWSFTQREGSVEPTKADRDRYKLIDALVAALETTPDEKACIEYLHDLPKLTASRPALLA